jgi:sec-independent protein translocase protein TatA
VDNKIARKRGIPAINCRCQKKRELIMPNLGTTELIIILVVVILIFGLGKLPEVGRGLGQSIHDFRAALINDENEPET